MTVINTLKQEVIFFRLFHTFEEDWVRTDTNLVRIDWVRNFHVCETTGYPKMWAGTPYSPDEDVGRDKNTVAQYFCTAWEIHLQQIIWELLCKDIISQRDLKSYNSYW